MTKVKGLDEGRLAAAAEAVAIVLACALDEQGKRTLLRIPHELLLPITAAAVASYRQGSVVYINHPRSKSPSPHGRVLDMVPHK